MLIIPEIETVVILVPRTGTGSLYHAVMAKYPKAFMPYRHMEADGVLPGYDRWRKVGVVRHPVDRLWSMYNFCKMFGDKGGRYDPQHVRRIQESVDRDFSDWIINNEVVFACPWHRGRSTAHSPKYSVNHSLPENGKSQHVYLRPDLGTEVFPFYAKHNLAADLGVKLGHENATLGLSVPILQASAINHIEHVFAWDLEQFQGHALTGPGKPC